MVWIRAEKEKIMNENNLDKPVVSGFGDEWTRFDQSKLSFEERQQMFDHYFAIFPWKKINSKSEGFDMGCGSGRWAKLVAPRIKKLHCIDPSVQALKVAKNNLKDLGNCEFHNASVDKIPIKKESMDFGYALGVLHHVPNTQEGLNSCIKLLKPGAPFLVYLYYSFDNRPNWYRNLWRSTELGRYLISRLPFLLRFIFSQIIAFLVYLPLAKTAKFLERVGIDVTNVPLSAYRFNSLYSMRTDALDRFGTRLEQRFSKEQIKNMMQKSGLEDIYFSDKFPFWCAVGTKKIQSEQLQPEYNPLVSVVVNCYNGEKYLKEALDSIYAQTYKNWEIIFWDNASTDRTAEIAKSYDKKLKYYRSAKTTILGEARVQATKRAKGKYLAFLDSDDLWLPNKLKKQVSMFSGGLDEVGFVYGRTKISFSENSQSGFIIREGEMLPEGDIFEKMANEDFVVFSSVMVDRDKFFKCGGFPAHFLNSTDFYILMRLAKNYKCLAEQELCSVYRLHNTNLSRKQRVVSWKESIAVLDEFLPDSRVKVGIKKRYAHLALVYLREMRITSSIKVAIKQQCFLTLIELILKRLSNLAQFIGRKSKRILVK